MGRGPPPMDRTSVSYGSLEAVEGAGLVTLEADHVETVTWLTELLCRWLKQNAGHVICFYYKLTKFNHAQTQKTAMSSQLYV